MIVQFLEEKNQNEVAKKHFSICSLTSNKAVLLKWRNKINDVVYF